MIEEQQTSIDRYEKMLEFMYYLLTVHTHRLTTHNNRCVATHHASLGMLAFSAYATRQHQISHFALSCKSTSLAHKLAALARGPAFLLFLLVVVVVV